MIVLASSHIAIGVVGFMLGIYTLPLLIAPPAPSTEDIQAMQKEVRYTATFTKDLAGSDTFHWGEGTVSINKHSITFIGELAPGPDYKLYLSPRFVETEAEFESIKSSMLQVGNIKTFSNFATTIDPTIDIQSFNTVIVWCETFGQFITAAKFR